MNASQWAIVMLVTMGAAAANPALRQDAPIFGAVNAAGVASIPDLSGIWGRNFFI
jgi:hypothetical protein